MVPYAKINLGSFVKLGLYSFVINKCLVTYVIFNN
jgi:hypothetical protein